MLRNAGVLNWRRKMKNTKTKTPPEAAKISEEEVKARHTRAIQIKQLLDKRKLWDYMIEE